MIKSASQYHHHSSYQRDKMTPHYLDWQNQPEVFKDYAGVIPVSLPSDRTLPDENLSSLIKGPEMGEMVEGVDVEDLSLILRLSHTLTAKARHAGGDHYFRSVASAGALYPTELYVATHSLGGLDDGLYHFAIHRHCLYPIRTQDISSQIVSLTQTQERRIPVITFFLTAIFFRSAWKYRDRSYRYHLLDTGHLLENLVLALKALRRPFNLTYDFKDAEVNKLLGLDDTKEVCLAVVHVSSNDELSDGGGEEIAELPEGTKGASVVAAKEIDYPALREFHQAGALLISGEKTESEMLHELGVTPETWTKCIRPSTWSEIMNYSEALYRRRSRRNFVKEPINEESAGALIDALCKQDFPHSTEGRPYHRSLSTGFLADQVETLEPGFYLLDTRNASVGLVTAGLFMEGMAHICLDQHWLANAAMHFLFLVNLDRLDQTWSARGYRYAMLTAGRMGQRLYMSATAMGLGCCGIGAFYDGEAKELLGLGEGARLLYVVAVGPVKSKVV